MKFDKNQVIYQAKSSGLRKSQVQINLSPAYNRNTTNEEIEKSLEKKWNEKCKENPRLYGQSKFRFHSMVEAADGKVFYLSGSYLISTRSMNTD